LRLWKFIEIADAAPAAWIWQVIGPSGETETASQPHLNYGTAVTDAIRHGFEPGNDRWTVVTPGGITRFEPAEKGGARSAPAQSRPAADGKASGLDKG
jgi:hypothetical protein